jgi:probable rRNA maturation factor
VPPRSVEIQNRHPRLQVPAAAVRRAIALLDEHFRVVPADLPTFAPARRAELRAALRSPSSVRRPRSSVFRPPSSALCPPSPACPPGELSLVFLTDPALAQIHADFMDDQTATDVITFEGDALAGLAGEICVSADTAAAYVAAARPRASRPQRELAFAAELTLYLVHGWLHLAGYDDLRPAKKRRMRAAEARAMKLLAAHDAVPAFRLR